jgi:hypothetical protein
MKKIVAKISSFMAMITTIATGVLVINSGSVGAVGTADVNEFSPICVGSATTFAASTAKPDLRTISPAHAYGTLGSAPNYKLFYTKVASGGILNISQSNSSNVDVDGALWGPFNNVPDLLRTGATAPTSYQNLLASDYLTSPTFNFNNINVLSGKYYVLLIANYSGSATNISFNTGVGTTATSDCNILNYALDITASTSTVVTTEGGATASYTVTLTRPPSLNVSVAIANTTGQVTASPATLTFTPANWYVPQTVTVSAVNDLLVDGLMSDTITNTTSSSDPNYIGRVKSVAATAADNDVLPTITNNTPTQITPANQAAYTVSGVCTANSNSITVSVTDSALPTPSIVSTTSTCAGGVYSASLALASLIDGAISVRSTITDGVNMPVNDIDTTSKDTTIPIPPVILTTASSNVSSTVAVLTNDNTPSISGSGESSSTVTVQNASGATICTAVVVSGSWSCSPTVALADGDVSLVAVQVDAAGNASAQSPAALMTIDTSAPLAPVILQAASRAANSITAVITSDNTPTISGSGEVGSTTTVIDALNTVICSGIVDATGAWTCTPSSVLADGIFVLSATQTDLAGNISSVSNIGRVSIDTIAPAAPIITNPGQNSTITTNKPAFIGTGESGSAIKVYDETGLIMCETVVASNGQWSCTTTSGQNEGLHNYTAKQTDLAGNVSLPSNPPTVVTLDINTDGATSTEEDASPNGGDSNADGVLDSKQQNVAARVNPATQQYETLEAKGLSGSCAAVSGYDFTTEAVLPSQDGTNDYPIGLIKFKITCMTPGGSANVRIILGAQYDTSKWVYKKYNSLTKKYTVVPNVTYGTLVVAGKTVTTISYRATDGDATDEDGTVNGEYADPSGPAVTVTAPLANTGYKLTGVFALVGVLVMITLLLGRGKSKD